MKTKKLLMLFASVAVLTACSSDDPFDSVNNMVPPAVNGGGGGMVNGGGGTSGSTAATGELLTFDVAIDKTSAEPTSTVSAYYPETTDDISTQAFTTKVTIDMANPVAKTENGVEITVNEGHVTANHGSTEGVCYVVSGTTTNGSLTIEGSTDFEVNLSDANINNPASTALDLESKMAAYLVLSGTNKLTDGTTEDHKGALYSKGKLLISGDGALEVYGTYNNGIHSKSYVVIDKGVNLYVNTTVNHGIKASDYVVINGGIINVETEGEGAKGINCEKDIVINGGRTNVVCTGDGEWDTEDLETKAATCIKCDSILTIKGGEINVKATGSGGKGLKADWEAYISGGKIRVITTGGLYFSDGTTESHNYTGNTDNLDDAYTSSPKGIKIGTLTISGGTVVAVGTNNDGIDANGDMYLTGGTLIAMGAGGAEAGIDISEQKKLYISGTKIFGIGGRFDGSLGSTTQGIATTTGSISANATVTISSGSTTLATFTMPPYSYNNGTIFISAPGMENGSSYTLALGNSSQTVTASNTINNRLFR